MFSLRKTLIKRMRKTLILLISITIQAVASFGASVRLTVDAGRGHRSVEEGQLFYIYYDVTDADGRPETPREVPGAKIMYFEHTGSSSSMSTINGRTTSTSSNRYTLTLRAVKQGSYTFGPVSVAGVKSNQVSYVIGNASSGTPSQPSSNSGNSTSQPATASKNGDDDSKPKFIGKGDSNLFMRASVTSSSVYEQQALVYTVKLYTTYDAVKFIGATAAPKFDGFVVEESKDVSRSLTYETYNGKTYATAVIARYIIFPQMPGQLKVTGNTYTVSVDQREYYHDPFWGNMSYSTPLQLNVTPNDLVVNVRPLPTPKPADFSGGVGKFAISSVLKSKELKTNVAASIIYTVKGTGNLKYIQLENLDDLYPAQLEVYSPTTDVQAEVEGSNVSGSVTFDYSIMPLEEGFFTIPDVKLVYFNPETGKYESSVARGYRVQVGKGVASDKSQSVSTRKMNNVLENVDVSKLRKSITPLVDRFSFWLWYIIPVVLLLAAQAYRRYYDKSHSDMAAYYSKRADRYARRRLKKANKFMRGGKSDQFYDELLRGLWGYLADKLKIPTSELMRDNIRLLLDQKGVEDSVISPFLELLDQCEYAKYSPEGGEHGMQKLYDEAITVINNMEKSLKEKKS